MYQHTEFKSPTVKEKDNEQQTVKTGLHTVIRNRGIWFEENAFHIQGKGHSSPYKNMN